MPKLDASLSLDLDNQWSYMKTHGDSGWESFPTYLDVLLPRVLDFFNARDLRITFFVVGQDAALEKNTEALSAIAPAGHEIGNHSFHHEPWLHRYAPEDVEAEIDRAQDVIERATSVRPTGFRGPGFSLSAQVLRTLRTRGFHYDASTFPTYIGPLARAYYFLQSSLTADEKEDRKALFGSVRDGLRPVKPYRWALEGGELLEVPVTTMPLVKAPFHLSYILYLSTHSPVVARGYFRAALEACRVSGVEPSVLLHPLDFLGADDVDALSFFPGMQLAGAIKRERVAQYLEDFRHHFDVLPLGEHARRISARVDLPVRKPDLAS